MTLQECYKLLKVTESASNEDLTASFKRLARVYHPDKNRDKIEWATRIMANINNAYTTIMSHRFEDSPEPSQMDPAPGKKSSSTARKRRPAATQEEEEKETFEAMIHREFLIGKFVKLRESAKEALYSYFQYNLYNMALRDMMANQARFKEIVFSLRRSYHTMKKISAHTLDKELIEHFKVFTKMLFNFYKASECLNILVSYSNLIDVEAYRLYKKGDEALHRSHREIFYDRHNRGSFKQKEAEAFLMKAEYHFRKTLEQFSDSSWSVETSIKLEYAKALKNYLDLFFNE